MERLLVALIEHSERALVTVRGEPGETFVTAQPQSERWEARRGERERVLTHFPRLVPISTAVQRRRDATQLFPPMAQNSTSRTQQTTENFQEALVFRRSSAGHPQGAFTAERRARADEDALLGEPAHDGLLAGLLGEVEPHEVRL